MLRYDAQEKNRDGIVGIDTTGLKLRHGDGRRIAPTASRDRWGTIQAHQARLLSNRDSRNDRHDKLRTIL